MINIEEFEQLNIVVNPDIIIKSFPNLPFPLKKNYKEYCKDFQRKKSDEIEKILALEIRNALNNHYDIIYVYERIIIISKTRMAKKNNNKGKSAGWRIIGLIDKENEMFILFDIYSHEQGKDNITKKEKEEIVKIAKAYYEKLKE